MKRERKKGMTAFLGFLIFFFTVSVAVTVAVVAYDRIGKASNWNYGVVTVVMFFVILTLSALCSMIEFLRHKWTVERNVEEILDATQRIAEGDFGVRLSISHSLSAYDDFDRIRENVNVLAKELSKTELLRSDFISAVSHELKTPLSVIRSYALALEDGGMDELKRKKYIKTLVAASDKLSNLVTNILKLNKLENAEILPESKPVNVTESLAECVLSMEEKIEAKKIELTCDLSEDVYLTAPEGLLELVWNNLLSNAVKFTNEGGAVSVTLRGGESGVAVRVTDSGVGFDAETGKHIFEKFYQGDTSRASEGNGLGLPLVKRVVDLLGGEISVESTLGKGTTFTVYFRRT
ncbi:MAG: HAMP domain-containing histidine kinase [Clostridia bacterium]|nr:HAMP domain-containing histidine kinase [Clostridia bacterium]